MKRYGMVGSAVLTVFFVNMIEQGLQSYCAFPLPLIVLFRRAMLCHLPHMCDLVAVLLRSLCISQRFIFWCPKNKREAVLECITRGKQSSNVLNAFSTIDPQNYDRKSASEKAFIVPLSNRCTVWPRFTHCINLPGIIITSILLTSMLLHLWRTVLKDAGFLQRWNQQVLIIIVY